MGISIASDRHKIISTIMSFSYTPSSSWQRLIGSPIARFWNVAPSIRCMPSSSTVGNTPGIDADASTALFLTSSGVFSSKMTTYAVSMFTACHENLRKKGLSANKTSSIFTIFVLSTNELW